MRQLSKELNGLLSGRGGGSQQMAQGTFFAAPESVSAALKNCGFRPAKESGDEPGEQRRL